MWAARSIDFRETNAGTFAPGVYCRFDLSESAMSQRLSRTGVTRAIVGAGSRENPRETIWGLAMISELGSKRPRTLSGMPPATVQATTDSISAAIEAAGSRAACSTS
jgi:hypothetical protein